MTAVNLFMFAGGFVLQWALGIMVEWSARATGQATPASYGAMFLVTAALGVLALAWFLPGLRRWQADLHRPG